MGRALLTLLSAAAAVSVCSVATVMVRGSMKRRRDWRKVFGILKDLEDSCETPLEKLKQIRDSIAVEMQAGLVSEGRSLLKMLVPFVDELPNGTERGTYYGLHLGSSYIRIVRVHLGGQRSSLQVQDIERHPIPTSLLNSNSKDFFDFLATSMLRFIKRKETSLTCHDVLRGNLRLLFLSQSSYRLSFQELSLDGLKVGVDIARYLQIALFKRGLDIHVAALVNDTVGALSFGYYHDPDTVAAVIFGTGTNACYLERTNAVIKCQNPGTTSERMVLNLEWGNFCSSLLPITSYDGSYPYDMAFEKMIGGMYLGEIVRRVIHHMSEESDIFGHISSILSTPFALRTDSLIAMHEDDTPELLEVARVLNDLGVSEVPLEVRKLVVRICNAVTRRAARLGATGIAAILKKIGRDGSGGITSSDTLVMRRTVVVVEGSLYLNYKMFREYMNESLRDILGESVAQHVVVNALEDASTIGSALLVASSHRG